MNYLLKSFQYDNPRAEICCQLGYHYFDKCDYKKAIFWYELALKLEKPEQCEFYIPDYWGYIPNIQLCVCYNKLNNLDEAIKFNEKAARYKPNSPAVLYNRKYFSEQLLVTDLKIIEMQKILVKEQREIYKDYPKPGVSLILSTNKIKFMDNIFKIYENLNYEPKELIIILNNNKMSIDDYYNKAAKYDNIKVFQLDESYTLGECLNYAIENSKYDYIAKLDDDDYYGENYLTDQMNVFNYTDADVTGKAKLFIYFENNDTLWVINGSEDNTEVTGVTGSTILAKKKVFDKIKFHNINITEDLNFFKECLQNDVKIFSNNIYNYICIRHKDMENHTWKVDNSVIENKSTQIKFNNNFEEIVTV